MGAAVKSAGFLMGTGVSGTRRGWSGTHGPLHAPRAGSKGDSGGRTRVGWGWRSEPPLCLTWELLQGLGRAEEHFCSLT